MLSCIYAYIIIIITIINPLALNVAQVQHQLWQFIKNIERIKHTYWTY